MQRDIVKLPAEEFPEALMEIPEPPKELWVAGSLPSPEYLLLTVVGSRKATSYGKEACDHLIGGLRGYPIAIVSGLALGTDTNAHEAALRAGLPTVAVPGSGISPEVIYPRSNVRLAERILDRGGALLSEYPPDFRATEWSFPRRNRIMAGLSRATLLIEATERSGTLITARLAAEYNRDVLVVPGSIFAEQSKGTHQFLKLGATPVTSPEDILHSLGIELREGAAPLEDLSGLPPEEARILELLLEPTPRDILIERSGLSVSDANIILMKLEIAGLIVESSDGVRRT